MGTWFLKGDLPTEHNTHRTSFIVDNNPQSTPRGATPKGDERPILGAIVGALDILSCPVKSSSASFAWLSSLPLRLGTFGTCGTSCAALSVSGSRLPQVVAAVRHAFGDSEAEVADLSRAREACGAFGALEAVHVRRRVWLHHSFGPLGRKWFPFGFSESLRWINPYRLEGKFQDGCRFEPGSRGFRRSPPLWVRFLLLPLKRPERAASFQYADISRNLFCVKVCFPFEPSTAALPGKQEAPQIGVYL